MKIAIGSDRRGFDYKQKLIQHMEKEGHQVVDVGPFNDQNPVDYPIYGEKVGKLVAQQVCDRGVVICATGIGIMIACNKIAGVRCGMGYSDEVAKLMREHNDANIIAFGQSQMRWKDVLRRLEIFIRTPFAGGYHCTRIEQIKDLEKGKEIKQSPFLS